MTARFDRPGVALIVDDEPMVSRSLQRSFERHDWDVVVAAGRAEALEATRAKRPTVAVVDLRIGCENGLDLAEEIAGVEPSVAIAVLTGFGSVPLAVEAMQRGVDAFLAKPSSAEDILRALREADERRRKRPKKSLAQNEREHIIRILEECRGNKSETARRLGVTPSSLRRKLSKNLPEK